MARPIRERFIKERIIEKTKASTEEQTLRRKQSLPPALNDEGHGGVPRLMVRLIPCPLDLGLSAPVLIGGLFFFAREDFPYLRDLRYLRHLHDSRHFRVSQVHVIVKTVLLRREACIEEQMEKVSFNLLSPTSP